MPASCEVEGCKHLALYRVKQGDVESNRCSQHGKGLEVVEWLGPYKGRKK